MCVEASQASLIGRVLPSAAPRRSGTVATHVGAHRTEPDREHVERFGRDGDGVTFTHPQLGATADDRHLGNVLRVERDGAVTILTLNRPEHLNVFDEALHHAFAWFWIDLDHDDSVRAVVLTGAGRAFCAGGSIDDFDLFRTDLAARAVAMRSARRLVDEMLNVRVPVVAAVNGPAVGLGATLSSLCDVVFVADTADLADPHVAVALVVGDGGAITWPHHTSLLKAKQYC